MRNNAHKSKRGWNRQKKCMALGIKLRVKQKKCFFEHKNHVHLDRVEKYA